MCNRKPTVTRTTASTVRSGAESELGHLVALTTELLDQATYIESSQTDVQHDITEAHRRPCRTHRRSRHRRFVDRVENRCGPAGRAGRGHHGSDVRAVRPPSRARIRARDRPDRRDQVRTAQRRRCSRDVRSPWKRRSGRWRSSRRTSSASPAGGAYATWPAVSVLAGEVMSRSGTRCALRVRPVTVKPSLTCSRTTCQP